MDKLNQLGLILIIMFCLSSNILCQNIPDNSEEMQLSTSDSINIKLNTEIQIMKEYNDDILSTVYWSLSFLGIIAVILISYGLYMNLKIYERDKEILKSELANDINKKLSNIKRAQLDENRIIRKESKDYGEKAANSLEKDINRQINYIKYDVEEIRAENAIEKKVIPNAIDSYIEMAKIGNNLKSDYFITNALGSILQLIESDHKPSTSNLTALQDLFNLLPTNFDILKSKINKIVTSSK